MDRLAFVAELRWGMVEISTADNLRVGLHVCSCLDAGIHGELGATLAPAFAPAFAP